jgi:hypothetical protein
MKGVGFQKVLRGTVLLPVLCVCMCAPPPLHAQQTCEGYCLQLFCCVLRVGSVCLVCCPHLPCVHTVRNVLLFYHLFLVCKIALTSIFRMDIYGLQPWHGYCSNMRAPGDIVMSGVQLGNMKECMYVRSIGVCAASNTRIPE